MKTYRDRLGQIQSDGAAFKILLPGGSTARVTIAQLEDDYATIVGTLDDAMTDKPFRLFMHVSQIVIVA